LLSVGVRADAATHSTAEIHTERLASWRAEISNALHAGPRQDFAAGGRRFEAHINDVLPSACRLYCAPSLPVRNNVKGSAQIKSPGRKYGGNQQDQHRPHRNPKQQPREATQATKTTGAAPGCKGRIEVHRSHGPAIRLTPFLPSTAVRRRASD